MKLARKISERYTWRVWIAAWYTLVFTVGLVAVFAGAFVGNATYRLLAALPVGAGVGLAGIQLAKLVFEIKAERLRMYMPAEMEFVDENDEGQVVAVTRGNGEHLMLTVPKGYHPTQDGGLLIVEQVCPKMPKGLHRAWKDAAVEVGLRRLLEDERE